MSKEWNGAIPFFTEDELACKGSGVIKLDIRFAVALSALRLKWGKPLSPTSVCRTPDHNRHVGGHPTSLHLTDNPKHPTNGTMAADLAWYDWTRDERLEFAKMAYAEGWSIGLNDIFIHIDRRTDIGLQQAIFDYGGQWSDHFENFEIKGF